MKSKLPKLASSLVAVARRDLMAVRRKKWAYKVDMCLWHLGTAISGSDVCAPCPRFLFDRAAFAVCVLMGMVALAIIYLLWDNITSLL